MAQFQHKIVFCECNVSLNLRKWDVDHLDRFSIALLYLFLLKLVFDILTISDCDIVTVQLNSTKYQLV
jgi:hypothetical protein